MTPNVNGISSTMTNVKHDMNVKHDIPIEKARTQEERTRSAISWRSVVFSLLGIAFMAGVAGYHDDVCRRPLMIGNHLPGGALTYMVFVGLVWNGLAGRLSRKLALSPRELVVVLCSTLVACFPPTSGLFRYFLRIVMLPWYYLPGNPDWSQYGLLDAIRPELFPAPYPGHGVPEPGSPDYAAYQRVYQGLFSGLAQGGNWVPLWDLPLRAWLRPLLYWGPLVFLVSLCCISLQFVIHRQWAHHEQLGYPLAQVTGRFCHRADGRPGVPDIFRQRLFWWGFSPVFLFYLLDFLAAKYPATFPSMSSVLPSLKSWWVPLSTNLPDIVHAPQWWGLAGQSLFFTIVGAAYFVSSEISLTMGVSGWVLAGIGLAYYHTVGTPISYREMDASRAGAYIGYALILLYTGRTYFRAVFARAFGSRSPGVEDDGPAVLAARVLVLSFAGLVGVLRIMGLELGLAFLYSLLMLTLFFVFTRIICETGIPFLQATWSPCDTLVALLGPAAIGPKALVMLHWTNVVFTQDPRECLMPYVATGAKVADDAGLRMRRVFLVVVLSVAVALLIAFLATAYTEYNVSAMTDGWASKDAVTGPFSSCARLVREMQDVGEYEAASRGGFLSRLALVRAEPGPLRFLLAGIALVVACSSLRFKFSKFPVHPVLFMVWGTTPATHSWYSFLVGWFLKTLVVRFGGGGVYQGLKPLFIGLIAGEVVFVGFHIVFNLVYLAIFHTAAPFGLDVLPG